MTIRTASPDDAPRLAEIYAYYVKNTAVSFEYDIPTTAEFRRRIIKTLRQYPYFVVEDTGIVQGYTYAGPFMPRAAYAWSCELSVYVAHEARHGGFGRMLYERMEKTLYSMGIKNLYACIGYPEKEDEYLTRDSFNFHKHLGFKQIGYFRHCGYKFGRPYSMVWLEKVIARAELSPAPVQPYGEKQINT